MRRRGDAAVRERKETMEAIAHDTETLAARELDCRGDLCPMPVFKTSKAMAQLGPGEVLRLLCTDPGAKVDIPALARQLGHELVATEEDEEGTLVFLLRRRGAA